MQINDVQFNVDLNQILLDAGFTDFKDTPDNVMVRCLYHKDGQERKPSAGIKKSDGMYHCFTCGEVHTLPEILSHKLGHTDDEFGKFGWNWLLQHYATINIESRKDIVLDFDRNMLYNVKSDKQFVSEQELDSYRYYHNYMYKRRLTNEIIEIFDIGYDRNTQCITFPVRDINGNCLFVARRSVNTKFFNYPSGAEKPLYGLYELTKIGVMCTDKLGRSAFYPDEIIICESMLDALTCWVYGKYAVALNGLGNDLQFEQLNKLPVRKYVLATDMDNAGLKARDRLRTNLKNKLITEYVWDVNVAKDINDMDKEMFDSLKEVF